MQRIHISEFHTEENGMPRTRAVRSRTRRTVRARRSPRRGRINIARVGVAAAACCALVALSVAGLPLTVEDDLDEMLGKLQFVSLPTVLEVFGPAEDKLALPVSTAVMTVLNDQQLARWESEPHAEVIASAAGEVRAVGEDPVLGPYVRLMHSDDLETIYYGLREIHVEEGQPVRRMDTLGLLGEDGSLCLEVLLEGRPQRPEEYFDVVLNT